MQVPKQGHYMLHYNVRSHDKSIGNISARGLRASDDLHHLASLQSEVASHGVASLDPHQLVLLQFVPERNTIQIILRKNQNLKSLHLLSSSCFSSVVMTTCSGTSSCSVMLIRSSLSRNCSRMYLGAMSTRLCLALGVMPCWTTMMALVMFSSCILDIFWFHFSVS